MRNGALLTLGIMAAGRTAWADTKIGYVDLQRVLAETEEGRKARSRLEGDFKAKQSEIDKRLTELKKAKEDFDKQKAMLQAAARDAKQRELDTQMSELQSVYMKHQEDLSRKEAQAMKEIFEKTQKIIQKIAQEEGISLVLEKTQSSILWAQPALDITNELVRRYNAGGGK